MRSWLDWGDIRMDYLSFDLRLGDWDSKSGQGMAEVLQSPAGEGPRYPFKLDVDIDRIAKANQYSTSDAASLGRRLSMEIFAQQSQTLWYESYQIARERGRGLRLRLHIDSWELSRLPWEFLHDARRGDFLVFDPLVSVVRYLRLYASPPALRQGQRLKLLAVAASPKDQAQLDWRKEFSVLKEALDGLVKTRSVDLAFCEGATREALHMALAEHKPDVVHYVGHGAYSTERDLGVLLLQDEKGGSVPVTAHDAARLFRHYGVNLVFLNACETARGSWAGLAPALVRREIPAVLAMQWPVEDRAAIRFSRHFYQALASGRTIDECVSEGRVGAAAGGSDAMAWAAPVLFLRSGSGRLWSSENEAVAAGQATTGSAVHTGQDPCFKTHGPLNAADTDVMIDRPELRRALKLAQQPSITQYVAILSARQMGKTTLLFRLMELLKGRYPCAFVDLATMRDQGSGACFRYVAEQIATALKTSPWAGSRLPNASQVSDSVGLVGFLADLASCVTSDRLIVMVDEVGALNSEASDALFNALRSVFTQGRGPNPRLARYLFYFGGAVDLYTLTYGSNSPLNICEKIYLSEFSRTDVDRLVGVFHRLNVSVPDGISERIFYYTAGHPYLTMRMCALLHSYGSNQLSIAQVDTAAEEMIVDDDNIHHLVRELDRRPMERRQLARIAMDGEAVPFSRNNPVLASLEMLGALSPAQPAAMRNRLYERAVKQYLAQQTPDWRSGGVPLKRQEGVKQGAQYEVIARLRFDAEQKGGDTWVEYIRALFRLVPALSLYTNVRAGNARFAAVLAVNAEETGTYWQAFEPAIPVVRLDLSKGHSELNLQDIFKSARASRIKLVVVMLVGGGERTQEIIETVSGTKDGLSVAVLDDNSLGQLLTEHGDLELLLKRRILEARLRSLSG